MKRIFTRLQLLLFVFGFFLTAFILARLTDAPVDEETLQRMKSAANSEVAPPVNTLQKLLLQEQLLFLLIVSGIVLLLLAYILKGHNKRRRQRTFLERRQRLQEQFEKEESGLTFEQRLLKEFPDLSTYELELSKLLLQTSSSKEIARKLNIDPASVNTARYRLRKKLQLQKGEDLVKFLLLFQPVY